MCKQKDRLGGGLAKIRSGEITGLACATFEHADARLLLEAVPPDFGGLYLRFIRQPSKQNLAFNLYGRRELDLFPNLLARISI